MRPVRQWTGAWRGRVAPLSRRTSTLSPSCIIVPVFTRRRAATDTSRPVRVRASPHGAGVTADDSILKRIAAGEAEAVSLCIRTYGSLIWSLARRYLNGDADAEDAVQDIFIELWSSAGRFDPAIASETAFVSTIARRRLIDRVRQRGRRPGTDSLDDDDESDARHPAEAPRLEEETDVAIVERVLDSLPAEQRQVLALSLYEGYSHGEIAERLDMPLGTVKTKVRRGLIYIREQLRIETDTGGGP